MDNKIKVSQLPECTDLTGLYTLGVDGSNTSVKVGLEFIATASRDVSGAVAEAESAAKAANEAAGRVSDIEARAEEAVNEAAKAAEDARTAVETATEASETAKGAADDAAAAVEKAEEASKAANDAASSANDAASSATSAAQSATEAATAAGSAAESATSAATSATEAAGTANSAAQDASEAAEEARQAAQGTLKYSAGDGIAISDDLVISCTLDIDRTFTIVPTPEDSTVIINGVERSSVSAWAGETVEWSVGRSGYETRSGETAVEDDTELPVALDAEPERIVTGVYVAYTDNDGTNRICATSDWDSTLGEAQGVLVGDGTHQIMVAPADAESTKNWASGNSSVDGCTVTTSSDEAAEDYSGKENTEAIVAKRGNYATDAYAGGYCNLYSYGNTPAGEWWLPSCGELTGLISPYYSDINAAMSAIGGSGLAEGQYYWSSTMYASNSAWAVQVSSNTVGHYGKTANSYYVRPVSSFSFEE